MSERRRNISARNSTGYHGVSFDRRWKSYSAYISINRKQITLGTFKTIEAAALAHDRRALQAGQPRSKLNYPDEDHGDLVQLINEHINDVNHQPLKHHHKRQKNHHNHHQHERKRKKRKKEEPTIVNYKGVEPVGDGTYTAKVPLELFAVLGTFGSAKEAALAYDEAVNKRSLSPSLLNFRTMDEKKKRGEDDEGLNESDGDKSDLTDVSVEKEERGKGLVNVNARKEVEKIWFELCNV